MTVGLVRRRAARQSPAAAVAVAALDDPVALVGGRAVDVDDLLATVVAEALGPAAAVTAVTVVHPTWWSRRRVMRVCAAASATARSTAPAAVTALSRSEMVRGRHAGEPVVLEIAGDLVAVCRRGPVRLFAHYDTAGIAALAAHRAGRTAVLIDAPAAVPGSVEIAERIREALGDSGIESHLVDILRPPRSAAATPRAVPRRRRSGMAAATTAIAATTVTAGAVAIWPRATQDPGPDPARVPVRVVEGRVAVEIPPGWAVRRVTGGPGSRRIEVTSPTDPRSALHITSAYTPESTLSQAAAVLGRAAAAEPAVFLDFDDAAHIAGRPALTYREVRPGRVVTWAVVLDGAMRIGIGCQSAPGSEESLRPVCRTAVASARDVGGTAPAPDASK